MRITNTLVNATIDNGFISHIGFMYYVSHACLGCSGY